MKKFYIVPKNMVAMEVEHEAIGSKKDAIKHFENFMKCDMNEYFIALTEEEYKKSEFYKN